MSDQSDWSRWSEIWASSFKPDADAVHQHVRRKTQRMRGIFALQFVLTTLTMVQFTRFLAMDLPPAWRFWGWAMVLFVLGLLAAEIRIRRGLWRAQSLGVTQLLELTERRARGGLRLVRLNVAGLIVLILSVAPLAVREWFTSPASHRTIELIAAANIPVVVGTVVWGVWYWRRQQRRIKEIRSLLDEYKESDPTAL